MGHLHEVYDTDKHFSIDPITRAIKNNSVTKTKVMQYDHNSERFAFIMPRTVEGHDMSLCDKVRVEFINIDAKDKTIFKADAYEVKDLQAVTSEDEEDQIVFSWLISQNATGYAGSLNFLIRFICYAEDGTTIEYAWHTDLFTGISVSTGMYNEEIIVEQYSDVLEAWKKELDESNGGISYEQIARAVGEYLNENPVQAGATKEQAEQIEKNKRDIEQIKVDIGEAETLLAAI